MELEDDMASLRINEKSSSHSGLFPAADLSQVEQPPSVAESKEEIDTSETMTLRRSTRKKNQPALSAKRRVITKPIKLTKDSSFNEIENYYLDKRVKRLTPSLETIYEESRQTQSGNSFMSSRKYTRVINFKAAAVSDGKIKKRKAKAKRATGKRQHNKKISIKFLIDKLAQIE